MISYCLAGDLPPLAASLRFGQAFGRWVVIASSDEPLLAVISALVIFHRAAVMTIN